jgi:hypothetical protein
MYLYILVIKYGESKLSNIPIYKQYFFYIFIEYLIYTPIIEYLLHYLLKPI